MAARHPAEPRRTCRKLIFACYAAMSSFSVWQGSWPLHRRAGCTRCGRAGAAAWSKTPSTQACGRPHLGGPSLWHAGAGRGTDRAQDIRAHGAQHAEQAHSGRLSLLRFPKDACATNVSSRLRRAPIPEPVRRGEPARATVQPQPKGLGKGFVPSRDRLAPIWPGLPQVRAFSKALQAASKAAKSKPGSRAGSSISRSVRCSFRIASASPSITSSGITTAPCRSA